MINRIREMVHRLYWELDINCARTTLACLSELTDTTVNPQTMHAAIGLHGAGGYRAQCGLVEGSLMFIGIFLVLKGKSDSEISDICYRFAGEFTKKFSSLRCCELRPNGFKEDDPPHACEELTGNAIEFTYNFIKSIDIK
ncbi:C_GCAxxG_C_C family protein [Clostridium sp. PL3]|uniref:C_GCAxxG_C_C family protein n=1 Tax=Clostridium thailandense TaxID=2794346 RepID=A0A949TTN9_9CLOT|nr:C-GCAxxG-C-C family (seleno)protein [Clostridium thailandense]MBV7275157.1 C_GCAxxG_C_C family protein [Clostridium thailandense]